MSLKKSDSHLLHLDSIRALTATYIVIHHAILQYYSGTMDDLTGIRKTIYNFFVFGHVAVDIFIVLSGYSLMLSVVKNDYFLKGGTLLFLKRRVIRIIPPYYAAVGLSLLLIWSLIGNKTGTHWDVSIPVTYDDVIKHIFLVHDFFREGIEKINHVFWSIAVEFRIYLFFPFLVWLWRKKGATITLLATVIITIIGVILLYILHYYNKDIIADGTGVSPYIILFSLGMFSADISFSDNIYATAVRKFISNLRIVGLMLLIIAFFVISIIITVALNKMNLPGGHSGFLPVAIKDILVGIFTGFILLACLIPSPKASKYTSWLYKALLFEPFIFVGTFSYSLYLVHAPLLQVLTQYIIPILHLDNYLASLVLVLAGTPLIMLIAYLFFYFFELPFLHLGKKKPIITELETKTIESPAP